MCTLIAAVRQYRDAPLVIAANRDEHLARPATGPRLWPERSPRFLAPRDEQAGGTWLGLNEHGLFVGVTNRFGASRDDTRASRGQLVVDALTAADARELHQRLGSLPADKYNAFHLFYADRQAAFVTWSDGEELHRLELGPGLHVITERSYADVELPRERVAREAWPAPGRERSPPMESLSRVLAIEDPENPLASLCIHVPSFQYGTRSSLVLKLRGTLAESELWSSDQPPCQQLPVPRNELLRELSRANSPRSSQ